MWDEAPASQGEQCRNSPPSGPTTSTRSGAVATEVAGEFDAPFARRFGEHFPALHPLFFQLYGERDDSLDQLAAVIAEAAASWTARSPELKARDEQREADPGWFLSNRMLGGVCYVDRFAGSLEGIRDSIPYFHELGLTYLHLMPLFESPEGNSDGGYAVSSYRHVNPALGTMDELAALATELRQAGISLVVDFIFNHTSNEHEWARKAVAGEPGYQDFYLIFPDRTLPTPTRRPCARSSPTTIRARSCSCRTGDGSGPRSTTSSGI